MTRFIVFGGQAYYATGGAFDILAVMPSEIDAVAFAISQYGTGRSIHESIDWVHVFDTVTATVVWMQGEALGQYPITLPKRVPITNEIEDE